MSSEPNLQISPSDLRFRFELRKLNPTTLTLTNPHSEPVAFKVKTTAPKKFCVRPSAGIVEPNTRSEVTVIMQAQRELPSDLKNCKDKFLIQAVKLDPKYAGLPEKVPPPSAFDKTKNEVQETKLRVLLEEPPAPPAPVMEDEVPDTTNQEQPRSVPIPSAPAAASVPTPAEDHSFRNVADDLASVTAERNKYKQNCSNLEKKLRDMQDELAKVQSGPAYNAPAPVEKSGFQLSMVHLLLACTIAFLVGHFLQAAFAASNSVDSNPDVVPNPEL